MSAKKASKIQRYMIKSALKLTNTKETTELEEITYAKAGLKEMKQVTADLEELANGLFMAQGRKSRLSILLNEQLCSTHIYNHEDRFAIFLNNMGKVQQSIDEVYQMYLMNMKDQLLSPSHHFNQNIIHKCQQKKVTLKTKKGQYDIKYKETNPNHNNKEQLESARKEFINSVKMMQKEKLALLESIKQYMGSYGAYAKIHEQNLSIQNKMYWAPPNINNKMRLDSDTEDINDNTETMSNFTDWGKSCVVVKQGWIKKRGRLYKQFKKRWFTLYTNRKLVYLTDNTARAKLKGHINLVKVIDIAKHEHNEITINTQIRLWILQFDTEEEREIWFNVFLQTKGVTLAETASFNRATFSESCYFPVQIYPPSPKLTKTTDYEASVSCTYDGSRLGPTYNFSHSRFTNNSSSPKNRMIRKMSLSHSTSRQRANDLDATNPFFVVDDKQQMQIVLLESTPSFDPMECVGVDMKFKVIVNDIEAFEDKKLRKKVKGFTLNNEVIIGGEYVNMDVILLSVPQLYISAMDVVEIKENGQKGKMSSLDLNNGTI